MHDRGPIKRAPTRRSQSFMRARFVRAVTTAFVTRVYGEVSVAISESHFRLGVAGAGIMLVAGLTLMRFCGSVSIPPKSAPPSPTGTSTQLVQKGLASPVVYKEFLDKDATVAGLRVPSIDEMARKLPYAVDDTRHILEDGQPPIDAAGLKLSVIREGDVFVLQIENPGTTARAYSVVTTVTPKISGCSATPPIAHNAIVIEKGATERRVECAWRDGMALAVTRVETLDLPPLSAWYLSLVPPSLIGVDERFARAHRGAESREKCATVVSQAVRNGLEQGQIGWRDLADYYARHRCASYRFPISYRAFERDGERPLPVVEPGI
ncbi:MAG: hypothetical protein SFX73_27405 [Kofleriaceae bacterium]|nr:hypothetical protein [Kofleriaceae bacterium]